MQLFGGLIGCAYTDLPLTIGCEIARKEMAFPECQA
jgi:hypothetical protein